MSTGNYYAKPKKLKELANRSAKVVRFAGEENKND